MKIIKRVFIIIIIILALLLSIRAYNGYRLNLEKQTRFMMDTYVTIYAVGPQKIASKAVSLALDRMQEIDVKFNHLNPKSPVYDFNINNKPITDSEILDLVRVALKVSKESAGAFDITIAPLAELWGFYSKQYYLPTEQEIKDCLTKIGYEHLLLKNDTLTKDNIGVKIDLGGIAKGYALVEAAKVLKANKVTSALIDAGGDVYALGKKGSQFWKVGIKDPRGDEILGYIEVEDLAVLGSGDYERYFIKDGRRYHHIFDPKTGYPTEGVIGANLIYSDPVVAQAWGKAPFIMGAEKGLAALERIPGMGAIVVLASKEVVYSKGLKNALQVIPKEEQN